MAFSDSFQIDLDGTTPRRLITTTRQWTEMTLHLRSDSDGENKLIFGGGQGRYVPAGSELKFTLAPNTKVEIETTASSVVNWHFTVTELSHIDDSAEADEAIHRQLDEIRCGIAALVQLLRKG